MTINQKKFLLLVCEALDVDASYFIDPATSVLRLGFKLLCELRMQEVGLYSFAELGRRLGLEKPGSALQKVKAYDAQATRENREINDRS